MSNYKQFTIACVACGSLTSKAFARKNSGKCKSCVIGVPKEEKRYTGLECPTCHQFTLTRYQKQHGYHCDGCTREADPQGYINEIRGLNDGPDY